MFDSLTKRFEGVFSRLRGSGRLSEADIELAATEIRQALLEADVNLVVVDALLERVRSRAATAEVSASLTPGQQVIKIVSEELTHILGSKTLSLSFASQPPTVILLAGLQGAGKTTAAAKLAHWFKSQGRNPSLVAVDLSRPAAIDQLRTLAERIDVPVYSVEGDHAAVAAGDTVKVAAEGVSQARSTGRDIVIVDTAGRLAVDTELMSEIALISDAVSPHYTLLVLDSMTGQDAVSSAVAFHATLEIDAVILTKLDGDARGGAALSVSEVVGRPIAFASVGESVEEFEQFHPDRMASRILGMGDVESLIEKAEQVYEADQAAESAQRLMDGTFTLDDFVDQLRQVKKMGNLSSLVSMMPGVPSQVKDADLDDGRLDSVEAIVMSMTRQERSQPDIIDGSRRARIAAGSGTTTAQVSAMLKQFAQMKKMMSSMGGGGPGGGRGGGRGGKSKKKSKSRAARSGQGSNRGQPSRTQPSRTQSNRTQSSRTQSNRTGGGRSAKRR